MVVKSVKVERESFTLFSLRFRPKKHFFNAVRVSNDCSG